MGIYDREYVRTGPRSQSGLGNLRAVSFNTWLMIANIVVFVIGALFFSHPSMLRPTLNGDEFFDSVPPEVAKRSVCDETQLYRHPGSQGVYFYALRDPATPGASETGVLSVDRQGRPLGVQVGRRRMVMMPPDQKWGHFSTGLAFFRVEVWRFITFQFLHANLMHLLFNMLGLWFVGGLVEQYLGSKRYAAFYLTCGIFGAVMYLLLNFAGYMAASAGMKLPGFLFSDVYTPLVGASAGIFGVMMAAAFIAPSAMVTVMGILPMRLRTAVYTFTALALANLIFGGNNAGGDAAHIGGAIAGYYFIRHTHLLRDFFDLFGDSRKPRAAGSAAPGGAGSPRLRLHRTDVPDAAEVDRILMKVASQGLASLTDSEKHALRAATEARRGTTSGGGGA